MILYNERREKVNFNTENQIGDKTLGNVYRISDTECLKSYKNVGLINKEILETIKKLHLRNYYEILDFYYSKAGLFKGHTMRYYPKEDINILTMPTEYTLDNLFRIQRSVNTLTNNNILIEDTHTENVIMDSNDITVIDVDLYSFSHFSSRKRLEIKNIERLQSLFRELFKEAIPKYHSEYQSFKTMEVIEDIFQLYTPYYIAETYRELSKYKYPIDYIKKKIKSR